MNEIKIYAFIKAVDKKFFDSFINEGQICMNTIKWFREYEKFDKNIGDGSEGAIATCGNDFTISFAAPIENFNSPKELNEKIDKANWSKKFSGENLRMFNGDDANILSLYAITYSDYTQKLNGDLVPKKFIDEFSNHRFILIYNPRLFISRMEEAISKIGKSMKLRMVEYYKLDNKLKKDLSFFHKQDIYSYQNEFRFILKDKNPEMKILNIGSLVDICAEIDLHKQPCSLETGDEIINIRMEDK
ncbi:MAG: hypothetical protein N4A35_11080 [Flavobacteriales bacterium]|jgi:hypothetical protein|nr:hypothetical protein [Flavobacteriales bacterium]